MKQNGIYGILTSVVNVIDRREEYGDIFKIPHALNAHCNTEVTTSYGIIVHEKIITIHCTKNL